MRPEPRARLVLVRLRPAEIGQHAIAHELGDVAVEAGDLAGHGVLVAPHDLPHLLRIAAGGQCRGAHEIDEEHGKLPAFRRIDGRFAPRRRYRLCGDANGLDGLQEPSARSEGDAQVLEVAFREVRQDVEVDLLLLEDFEKRVQSIGIQPF